MSSSKKKPDMPDMPDPMELIRLQSEVNRVNLDTPFGSQTYVPGADGSTTLRTDIGPMGQQLLGRGVGLGMTDSARQTIDPRMNELAGALLGRVGNRFGMDLGGSLQLAPNPAMPPAKGGTGPQMPGPQLPGADPGLGSPFPGPGGNHGLNPRLPVDRRMEPLIAPRQMAPGSI